MLLHLEPPPRRPHPTGQVLAIEPNPVRANTLKDLLRDHVGVDLDIVPSVEDAIRSISGRIPDLVITSTFLPPADEAALIAHLKERPAAAHVQVIIVPHFVDQSVATTVDRPRTFRFLHRTPLSGPGCDPTALGNQIADYLVQARAASAITDDPGPWYVPLEIAPADVPMLIKPELRLVHPCGETVSDTAASGLVDRCAQVALNHGRDRRRAQRRPSAELPWLWSARLASGTELKLVDVSNSGVMVETAAKIALGSTVDLRLIGQDTDLCVPARVLRSVVSQVDALGVRYHIAAAFGREVQLLELAQNPAASDASGDPGHREVENVVCGVAGSAARVRFEQELRRLLAVRDILIRHTPVVADDGAESVYFSIPGGSGSILQVIFERNHEPSPTEFEVMKAAARLAGAVLEFVPPRDIAPHSAEALAG